MIHCEQTPDEARDRTRTVKEWCAKLRHVATFVGIPASTQQQEVQRSSSSVLRIPGSRLLVMALQTALNRVTLYRIAAGDGGRRAAAVDGEKALDNPVDPFGSVVLQEEEGNAITCMTLVRHDSGGHSYITLWIGTSNGTMLLADANIDGRVLAVCQFPRKLTSSYNVAQEHDAIAAICPSSITSSLLANPWLTLSDGATVGDGPHCYTKNIDVVHASGYCVCVRGDALEELLRTTYAAHRPTVYQEKTWPRPCLTHDWDRHRIAFPYAGASIGFAKGLRDGWILAAVSRDNGDGQPAIVSACSAMLPAGGGSSALALLDAAATVKSQRLLFTVQNSDSIVAYSLHNKAAAPLSTGRAAIEIAGRLTGAALKAVKGFWSRSKPDDGHAVGTSGGPAEELVVHGNLPCDSDLLLRGVSMEGSLQLSPAAKYAAVCTSNGRVLVVDTISQTLCKVLKGCRNASVQWLQVAQNSKRKGPRADLVLAVYLPLRGVLEFHRMSTAQRVCAIRIGAVTLLQMESCSTLLLHELFVLDHGTGGGSTVHGIGAGGGGVARVLRVSLHSMEAFAERRNRQQMLRSLQPVIGEHTEPSAAVLARFVGVGVSTTLLAVIRGALEQLVASWNTLHNWLVSSEGHSVHHATELVRVRTESDLWALWQQMYAFVSSVTPGTNTTVTAEDLCEASEALLHAWRSALGVPVAFSEVVSTKELNPSSGSHRYHCIVQLKRLGEAFLKLCAAREEECGREGEGKTSPLGNNDCDSVDASSASYSASVVSFLGAALTKRSGDLVTSPPALSTALTEALRKLATSPAERAWLESDEVVWSLWNRATQTVPSWIDVCECAAPHPLAPRRLLPAAVIPHFPSFLRCFTPYEARIGPSQAHARALSNLVHNVRLALIAQREDSDDSALDDLQQLVLTFLDDRCAAASDSVSAFLKKQSGVLNSLGVHSGSVANLTLMFLTSSAFAGLRWEWSCASSSAASNPSSTTAAVLRTAAVIGLARVLSVDTLVNWVASAPFAPARTHCGDNTSRVTQIATTTALPAAIHPATPSLWTCWPPILERITLLVFKAAFTSDTTSRVALMSRVAHLVAAGILLEEALQHNRDNPAISQSCHFVLKTDPHSSRLEHPLHWIFDNLAVVEGENASDAHSPQPQPQQSGKEVQQDAASSLLPRSRMPSWIREWSFRWTKEFPPRFLDAWQALHIALNRHTVPTPPPLPAQKRGEGSAPSSSSALSQPATKTWDDKRFAEECLAWYDASVYHQAAEPSPLASRSVSCEAAVECDSGVLRVITLFAMAAAMLGPVAMALRASGATAEDRWFALVDLGGFMQNSSGRSSLAYLRSCTAVLRKLLKEYHDVFGRRLLSLADVVARLRDMDALQQAAVPSAVFHIYPMEYRAAVQRFCAFAAAHLDGHDACFLDLLDVVSVVELVAWNASNGHPRSSEQGSDKVAWTSMFSVSSLSLLDEKTVYPHLAEELLASMAAQRQTSRLQFLHQQALRYVLGAGSQHVLIEEADNALQPLVAALQVDPEQARAVLEITVLTHWMKCSDFNDASTAAIQQLVQTSSVRALLARALLPWMRRYVYTTVKWFVSLEKSIPPESKEQRVRHAANSVRIRTAMTPRFEAWLRQRGSTSSARTEQTPGDHTDVLLEWFYEGGSDEARVDSNLRRLVGLHKVKGLLNVLVLLAEFCKVELAGQADSIGDDLRTAVLVIHTVVGGCV